MLPSGGFDGSQPVLPGLVGTQMEGPGHGALVITGARDTVAFSGPDLSGGDQSMGAFSDVPLALDAGLSRLIGRYFDPSVVARGMQMTLHHSGV